MNIKNFRNGVFWGIVFGGLVGLMNAPRSGYETRQRLKKQLDQTSQDVNDLRFKIDNLLTAVERLADEGLSSVKATADSVQTSLQHFQDETEPRIRRVKESVEVLQDSAEAIKENT